MQHCFWYLIAIGLNKEYKVKHLSVESLQSHFILTMSDWSSGLPVCFLSQGTRVQITWGVLMWNRDSPVSVVSLHWWPGRDWLFLWPVWGGLRSEPSLGPRADNVIIQLDLSHLLCPGFTLAAGPPSGFRTDGVAAGGGALWRPAISLHSHHVWLVQWTTRLPPVTRDLGSNPQGGTYVKLGFSC